MQLAGEQGVALCIADQSGDVRPDGRVGENFGGDMDSAPPIIERAADGGRIEARGDLVDEYVEQDRALGRPPPVDRLLADPGAGSDALNGEPRVPLLLAELVGGLQDCRLRAGAAA